jgi:hypothetical protein
MEQTIIPKAPFDTILNQYHQNSTFTTYPPILAGIPSSSLERVSMELSLSSGAASCPATPQSPNFYGTRRFITVFIRALHWFLS